MNKFLFVILSFFISSLCYSQKIKSVDEFDIVSATKKNYESYENLFEVKKIITSFGTFQKGDKLLINRPQNGNLLRFSSRQLLLLIPYAKTYVQKKPQKTHLKTTQRKSDVKARISMN